MKKCLVLVAVLTVSAVFGYKRDCMGSKDTNYTYALTILGAQGPEAVMCKVYLTSDEKSLVSQALASYKDDMEVTRDFYETKIKNQFGSEASNDQAIRRVVRDFGGSKKMAAETRQTYTIGDIRSML